MRRHSPTNEHMTDTTLSRKHKLDNVLRVYHEQHRLPLIHSKPAHTHTPPTTLQPYKTHSLGQVHLEMSCQFSLVKVTRRTKVHKAIIVAKQLIAVIRKAGIIVETYVPAHSLTINYRVLLTSFL